MKLVRHAKTISRLSIAGACISFVNIFLTLNYLSFLNNG